MVFPFDKYITFFLLSSVTTYIHIDGEKEKYYVLSGQKIQIFTDIY